MITLMGRGRSSKLLAKALGIKRNRRNADVVIRWKTTDFYHQRVIEINPRPAVCHASHKYHSLIVMRDAGLNVPQFTQLPQVMEEDIDRNPSHIWFGRKNYHSKGTDIVIYGRNYLDTHERESDIFIPVNDRKHDYYVQYLKPKAEYRYHVAFGKVILATKKILADGEEDDSLIRNHQGGKWRQVVCAETSRFSEACIKAVQVHGLHFGAVDFINHKREPYILEVNTAPQLQVENRLIAYRDAIKAFLSSL